MTVTTFFLVIALRGNRPPAPTCLRLELSFIPVGPCRLSSASRSRRRSEKAYPFRTSTRLRIAAGCQSHTIFAQRGSVYVNLYILRIAADGGNVNGSSEKATSFDSV